MFVLLHLDHYQNTKLSDQQGSHSKFFNLLWLSIAFICCHLWLNIKPSFALVPDYASITIDEISIRSGPGRSYPVKYIYRKRGMPVKLLKEYDNWYQIEDFEGDVGWAAKNYVNTNFKTVIVTRNDLVYRYPNIKSRPIFRVEKNVIMNVKKCKNDFCRVFVNQRYGWINKQSIWGTW